MSGERARAGRPGRPDGVTVADVVYLEPAAAGSAVPAHPAGPSGPAGQSGPAGPPTSAARAVSGMPARRSGGAVTPHLQTWRPYTMFYVGLVGLAGALLADRDGSALRLCGAWLVPTLGWVAGHYGADYFDRDLDAVAKPHRPIPSGRMRPATGLAGMVACASAGGALAVALNWRTVLLVAAALLTGIAYSSLLKAHGLAGNLVRGSLIGFAFLFGAMAVRTYPAPGLLVVAAVFVLHDTATNLVGTLRDIDGDRRSGCHTFPVRHGVAGTLAAVAVLDTLWFGLATCSPLPLGVGGRPVFWGLLGLAGALAGCAAVTLVRAGTRLEPRQALRAHEILTLERLALACAFVGLSAGLPVALALLLPAAVLTGLLTVSMRTGYEFGRQPGRRR